MTTFIQSQHLAIGKVRNIEITLRILSDAVGAEQWSSRGEHGAHSIGIDLLYGMISTVADKDITVGFYGDAYRIGNANRSQVRGLASGGNTADLV